ncbi:MAG: hypothetical protein RSD13_02865 [Clostridium sp.]
MEEREIRRDLKMAEKFAHVSASLDALEKNKKIIRVTITSEADKQKFEELLEIGQEYSKIMERVKKREENFDVIKAMEELELDKVQLKVNYILKVLQQEYLRLDDGVATVEKTFNEKMKKVLEEGARLADGEDREKIIKETKEKSPIAVLMMETMKNLATKFAEEIRANGVRIIVPVNAVTEQADFDNVRLAYGEEGITEISLEEALKTISKFLPLIIQAELQQSFRKKQIRDKGEVN